jgi:hypothetical protein
MEKQNQPDSALHYYKLASGLYNQFNNQQRDLKVKELGIQFNSQKEKQRKSNYKRNIAGTRKLNITLFISVFVLRVYFG